MMNKTLLATVSAAVLMMGATGAQAAEEMTLMDTFMTNVQASISDMQKWISPETQQGVVVNQDVAANGGLDVPPHMIEPAAGDAEIDTDTEIHAEMEEAGEEAMNDMEAASGEMEESAEEMAEDAGEAMEEAGEEMEEAAEEAHDEMHDHDEPLVDIDGDGEGIVEETGETIEGAVEATGEAVEDAAEGVEEMIEGDAEVEAEVEVE